jgi:hypothetical protein
VDVVAVAPRGAAGLRSRYASARVVAPDPAADPEGFAEKLAGAVAELRPRVIYPGREEAIDAMVWSPQHGELAQLLPYERLEPLEVLRDKRGLPDLASEHGIDSCRTLAEGPAGAVLAEVGDRPCAVKSALPGGALEVTRLVESADELRALLEQLPPDEQVVIQEHCVGELVGLAMVVDGDGRLLARFQQAASRTWPLEAGASANAVSVAPDASLVERGRRLLADAGYSGLAHMQFLRADDRCVLIDINPRFYGSMPLALAAGINLPAVWHGVVTGEPRPALDDYRLGLRFRWLEGNLLAAGRGDGLRALVDGGFGRRAGAVWSADDPLASAAWGAGALKDRLRRRVPLARRDGGGVPVPSKR